jgi:thymidine kinase
MYFEGTNKKSKNRGWVEVICGSMFSGKTEELIRRLRRAEYAKLKVEIFKPQVDVRYSEEDVVSHDETTIRSTPVESSGNILLLAGNVDVIGIDEAQFFDKNLVDVCNKLANREFELLLLV